MSSHPVVIMSGVQGDTRRYRAFHLCEQLRLAGYDCALTHIALPESKKIASFAKILILQRVPWDDYVSALIKLARKNGAAIISDIDDLIFDPESMKWIDSPDFSDPVRAGLYRQNLLRNRRTLLESDAILTSTDFLAEQVSQLGKPVWVHRNAFSLEMLASSLAFNSTLTKDPSQTIIGYASGTPTHDQDFALVSSTLKRLLVKHNNLYLHLVGHLTINPDLFGEKAILKNFVPWRELPKLLAQFSINLAPLRTNNPFSQSKSEIKFIEAALVKVPTIASPTQAFCSAIETGKNGFLAQSETEWEYILDTLIENPGLREEIGDNAFNDVMQKYAPWIRAHEIVKTLNQILDTINSPVDRLILPLSSKPLEKDFAAYFLDTIIEKHPTLFERGLYSLKSRGIFTLMGEIWVYFRRLLSPVFPFPKDNKIYE